MDNTSFCYAWLENEWVSTPMLAHFSQGFIFIGYLSNCQLYYRSATSLYCASIKSSQTVTGLWNRGPLKFLNDSKLILNQSMRSSWLSAINLALFRTFRGSWFHKPKTGQELFSQSMINQKDKPALVHKVISNFTLILFFCKHYRGSVSLSVDYYVAG